MDDVPLDLILSTGDHATIDSAAEQAQLAEDLGFSRVSAGEVTGWNIMPLLSVIAERTEEIGISDDVISSYSRTPSLLGQTALTMHDVTDGRFRLGLGASSPALAEKWHGQSFDRPLRRLRETIDIVREVYDGGDVSYEGDVFEIGGLSYDRSPPDDPPAIDVAALGPKATEMTGRFADGWVPQLFTPDGLADRMEDLRRGAELDDRDPDDLRVAPIIRCYASENRETARSVTRQMVAFLIGAYGPFYGDSVAEQGYAETVDAVREAWSDRDMAAMSAEIDDEMLDSLAAAGTPDEVRERVGEFAAVDGVDAIRVGFAAGMDQDAKRQTMEALADPE